MLLSCGLTYISRPTINTTLINALGYHTAHLDEDQLIVTKANTNTQELLTIAKDIQKRYRRPITILVHESKNAKPIHKVNITKDSVEGIVYTTIETLPETNNSNHYWDLSHNRLDLVTGGLTIEINMPNQSIDSVISTAHWLSKHIMESNPDASLSSVQLHITANDTTYIYQSSSPNTIGEYWKIKL